jgi:hypothetical protein
MVKRNIRSAAQSRNRKEDRIKHPKEAAVSNPSHLFQVERTRHPGHFFRSDSQSSSTPTPRRLVIGPVFQRRQSEITQAEPGVVQTILKISRISDIGAHKHITVSQMCHEKVSTHRKFIACRRSRRGTRYPPRQEACKTRRKNYQRTPYPSKTQNRIIRFP